jgi:hypothetical protein
MALYKRASVDHTKNEGIIDKDETSP